MIAQSAYSPSRQLSFVYAPPIPTARQQFWECLDTVGNAYDGPWLLARDFNAILNNSEKKGGRPYASSSSGGFHGFVDDNALLDLGYVGSPFT